MFVALLPALLVACDRDGTASPVTAPDVAVSPAAATATSTAVAPEPRPAVVIDVADPDEAADLDRQLVAAGFDVASEAPTRISDAPGDSSALEHARQPFALVVHPRLPLHDVTLEEAVAILDGTGNLGRNLVVSDTAAAWLARTHLAAATAARGGEPAAVIAEVAATPGLAGLVSMEELDPRVRALTIGGHDPYRDPWSDSPLLDRRTVAGPHAEAVAVALGWTAAMLPDPVGFLATGELIAARCVTDRVARLEARYDAIFDGTRHLLGAADLAMAHWEPAIVDDTPTPCTRTFNMSTRPEAAAAAARAGIDVALAVGNHVGDCWTGCSHITAVQQTVTHLRAAGLHVAGAGDNIADARKPALVTVDGIRFAFLGYDQIAWAHYGAREDSPGTAHADLDELAADVRAAAAVADHVIVGFSWGVEYVAEPGAREREVARTAIDAGASLVVGNHPHWVQSTEWIGDGFVAYGLGNFVFDQDWSVETTQGAVLEVGFTAERILGVRIRPTAIRQQHFVELVDPAGVEGMAILDQIWRATDAIAR